MGMNTIKLGYRYLPQTSIHMNTVALSTTVGVKSYGKTITMRWDGMESVQMASMLLKAPTHGKSFLNLPIQTVEKHTQVMSI